MRSGIFLLSACLATPAAADCLHGYQPLFFCEFPERNAAVELCRKDADTPVLQYSYWADGETQLEFTTDEMFGYSHGDVQGMHGAGYGTAVANKGTYFGFLVDGNLMGLGDAPSPNPAVLQVYASRDDLLGVTDGKPIARRVCDPSTIQIDHGSFGPG